MADGNRGKYRNNIGITSNKFMKKANANKCKQNANSSQPTYCMKNSTFANSITSKTT